MKGILYGVSVGPGDPELLTLKAVRIMKQAQVIALPCTGDSEPASLSIAAGAVPEIREKQMLRLSMPMTRDSAVLDAAHETAAKQIAAHLEAGEDVAFLTLGDVSIYATYGYVQKRVRALGYEVCTIAGVPSFCAAAALLGEPLVEAEQPLSIIPGSYPGVEERLKSPGTKVLMKTGKSLGALKELLRETGQYEKAMMAVRCGMPGEKAYLTLDEVQEEAYFSIVVIKD